MQVIANRQLTGSYGTVAPDAKFECPDDIVQQLLANGMVRNPAPPRVQYETKIIKPTAPEVGPREPFRDSPVSDQKPATVATEGDRVLPGANLPERGAADSRGRGGRSGPAARR